MAFLNRVSPEKRTDHESSTSEQSRSESRTDSDEELLLPNKQMEPGVWPGVSITCKISLPNLILSSCLMNLSGGGVGSTFLFNQYWADFWVCLYKDKSF